MKTYIPIGANLPLEEVNVSDKFKLKNGVIDIDKKEEPDTYASMLAGGYLLNTLMREYAEPTPPPHVTVTIQLNGRIVQGNIIALEDDGVTVEYFEGGLRFKLLIADLSKISLI